MTEQGIEDFQDAFARIEAALDAGDADLRELGYLRLLRRVKAEAPLSEHWADEIGRIDRKAFERHVRLRFPVWFGNAVLVVGLVLGAAGIVVARRATGEPVAGLGLLFAVVAWSVSVHCLAHWAVGRAVGIRFSSYFFAPRQFPPRPGLKTDYATYLRAAPTGRAWMHASGALATKAAPFAALMFLPGSNAPAWAAWLALAYGLFQIATDALFSTKTGDWRKVRRELMVARAQLTRAR